MVELWELSAADLLAMNDVGLVPWIPLTRWEGEPEALLRECRDRIDKQAPPNEHDSLLAVTAMLGSLRYNDEVLLNIFGGGQSMLEFPLLERLMSEREVEIRRRDLLRVLAARFGPISPALDTQLRSVTVQAQLDELLDLAALCPNLDAFRARLTT